MNSHVQYGFKISDRLEGGNYKDSQNVDSIHLVDFEPEMLDPDGVVGRIVKEVRCDLGTYGMGGLGFFGLKLEDQWLIISIYCAASWVEIDGRVVKNWFEQWGNTASPPWISSSGDRLTERIVGERVSQFEIDQYSLKITIGEFDLVVSKSSERRPLYADGSLLEFDGGDDLRRAVFLSPTAKIWCWPS